MRYIYLKLTVSNDKIISALRVIVIVAISKKNIAVLPVRIYREKDTSCTTYIYVDKIYSNKTCKYTNGNDFNNHIVLYYLR